MDQGKLVEKQINDGQRFIDRLVEEGIPITAAAWIKESESELWFLYLVTPLASEDTDSRPVYGRVNAVLRQMPPGLWVGWMEVKVVGPDSRVGGALLDLHRQYPGQAPIRYRGAHLGGVSVEGAYVYPPVPAPVGES
jgi:hypothetical protein